MDYYKYRRDKYYADQQLRHIDDTYVFDISSGLYKPKSYEAQGNRQNQPT